MIYLLFMILLILLVVGFFAYQQIQIKSEYISDIQKNDINIETQNIIKNWLKDINIIRPEFQKIKNSIAKDIFGMDDVINAMIIWLITKNHIIISGYPWLAKTSIVKKFSKIIGLGFGRIQWTVDIQPTDIIGSNIYNPVTNTLQVKLWPINANIVLVDEINRMTPKSQSALLQAMAENSITIDDKIFDLPKPFMVLATMNPHDDYGTFPVSMANLDRFAMSIYIDYPDQETEKKIMNHILSNEDRSDNLTDINIDDIYLQISNIQITDKSQNLILNIITNNRNSGQSKNTLWPRISIYISTIAKAIARLEWMDMVLDKHIYMCLSCVLLQKISTKYDKNNINMIFDLLSTKKS